MADDLMTDETRRLLRDSVAAFVAREKGIERVRRLRDRPPGYDRGVWRTMAEAGWCGLLLPEAHGGAALGLGELAVVMQELGRALAPEPIVPAAVLAGQAIAHGDDAPLQAELLPRLAAGALVPALAWQEANDAYDPAAVSTRVDGARLTGEKRFVPSADSADGFVVSALGPDGLGLWWVPRDAAGLAVESELRVDGGFIGRVRLDGVTDARRVASAAVAAAALTRAIDEARLAVTAEMVGVMGAALDLTLAYVKQREQFGKAIGSFQELQHRLVDMWTQRELAAAALRNAVEVFDRTTDPAERAPAVSAAKARAGDAGLLIARQGIQLHGGMGYTDECDIGLFLKRMLVLSAWLGNATAHRRRFAALAA